MVDLSSILEDLRGPGRWGGGCGASQADGAAGGAQETVRKGWKGSSYRMRRGPWGPLLWVETLGDSGSGPCRTLVSSSDLDRLSPALAGHGPSKVMILPKGGHQRYSRSQGTVRDRARDLAGGRAGGALAGAQPACTSLTWRCPRNEHPNFPPASHQSPLMAKPKRRGRPKCGVGGTS